MNWNNWHMMSPPAKAISVCIGILLVAAIIWAFKNNGL